MPPERTTAVVGSQFRTCDGVLNAEGLPSLAAVTLTYRKADQKEGVEFSVEQLGMYRIVFLRFADP